MRNRADKKPTFALLTQRVLEEADDFLTIAQVRAIVPDLTICRASASLAHLRKYGAADFMEADGTTYWFATPASDRRSYVVAERALEEPGTRNRGPRKAKTVWQQLDSIITTSGKQT